MVPDASSVCGSMSSMARSKVRLDDAPALATTSRAVWISQSVSNVVPSSEKDPCACPYPDRRSRAVDAERDDPSRAHGIPMRRGRKRH